MLNSITFVGAFGGNFGLVEGRQDLNEPIFQNSNDWGCVGGDVEASN